MPVNWGILQNVDVGGAIQQGFETGRQQQEQLMTRNALASLVKNPNDPNAINALAQYDPMAAMQFQGRNQQQQAQQREADVKMRASQGDPQAIAELAGIDWDAWQSLRPDDKDKMKKRTSYLGQSALAISQLPPQEQPAAWDAYIDQGVQMGYTDLAQYRGKYSPQALQGVIADAGLVENLWEAQSVDYVPVPEGARLEGFSARTGAPLGTSPVSQAAAVPVVQGPDAEDIDMLKNGQVTPAQFDEVFGNGMSQKYMNGGSTPQASSGFPRN